MTTLEELAQQQQSQSNFLDDLAQQVRGMVQAQQKSALEARLSDATPMRFGAYPAGASTAPAGSTPGQTNMLADNSVVPDTIAPGALDSIAKFAATIRPPVVVPTLPTLPDALYPSGSLVFLTTDKKLYKTETGLVGSWITLVNTTDLTGTITTTQITDGAISTPKLAANSVDATKIAASTITAAQIAADTITAGQIAAGTIGASEIAAGAITADRLEVFTSAGEIRNSTSEVVIDSAGVAVTNGAISVTNAGSTVIIDGTSDMFKIAATGTFSMAATAANSAGDAGAIINTGMTYRPASMAYLLNAGLALALPYTLFIASISMAVWTMSNSTYVYGTSQTHIGINFQNGAGSSQGPWDFRWYILKEAAI